MAAGTNKASRKQHIKIGVPKSLRPISVWRWQPLQEGAPGAKWPFRCCLHSPPKGSEHFFYLIPLAETTKQLNIHTCIQASMHTYVIRSLKSVWLLSGFGDFVCFVFFDEYRVIPEHISVPGNKSWELHWVTSLLPAPTHS